jgi:hypothetical protein
VIEGDKGAHWTLTTFEDSCLVPVICQLVDFIDQKKLPEKTYNRIAFDLMALKVDEENSINKDYLQSNTFTNQKNKRFKFYIRLESQIRNVINHLRTRGKFIFLQSNHHHDYTSKIMSICFGHDWKEFFDLILVSSCKPLFCRA